MKKYLLFLWMLGTIIGLTSCNDDEPNEPNPNETVVKRLKSITFTGSDNHSISLKYGDEGRLFQLTEEYSEPVINKLTYENGQVVMERFGKYYGTFILNEQGYVITFKRDNTADHSYKYNADGYLTESTNGEHTCTYTYQDGNLSTCAIGNSIGLFTAGDTKEILSTPALYQPLYLHILGNAEVTIGYLAGLYGKAGTHLMASSDYTIEKGANWETQTLIDYTYQMDNHGYVTLQEEKGKFYYRRNGSLQQGESFEGSMSFSYETIE